MRGLASEVACQSTCQELSVAGVGFCPTMCAPLPGGLYLVGWGGVGFYPGMSKSAGPFGMWFR